jgi:phytoene dehydrogenase-like protein
MSQTNTPQKSVIIIGAGIAGLSAAVYAQKNGFKSRIYEMHSQPGGLMTAWKRKGYTIDGCIHWLTGSNPQSDMHKMWEEIGLSPALDIYDPEIFMVFVGADGKELKIYANIDRFEQHLLEIAPEDSKTIKGMCSTARAFSAMQAPGKSAPSSGFGKLLGSVKGYARFAATLPRIYLWGRLTMVGLGKKFKNPFLRDVFSSMWMSEMSAAALLFTMAILNNKDAGYPSGGSLPMAYAIEKHYCSLGGEIYYNSRVEKIIVEQNPDGKTSRAVGIRLTDGSEVRADYVISAADGHATMWNMLDGKFLTDKIRKIYDNFKLFPPILMIGLGVNRTFPELPGATGGINYKLDEPIEIAGKPVNRLEMMIYNFDPTLAPQGKTVMTAMIETDYAYWKELAGESERYEAEKQRIGIEIIRRLDQRFPGLEAQVEMADVATPLTFERYTGNWQASFEGFLPTPGAMVSSIPKTLPGLDNFYMVGQWVQAGGGLPCGPITGKDVIGRMCKQEGSKPIY